MQNDGNEASPWLDDFLLYDFILVCLFAGLDWFLGPRKREALRIKCRKTFVHLRHRDHVKVYSRHARRCFRLIVRMLGVPNTRRYYIRSALLTAGITIPLILAVSAWRRTHDPKFIAHYVAHGYTWLGTIKTAVLNAAAVEVIFALSLLIALHLLSRSARILPENSAVNREGSAWMRFRTSIAIGALMVLNLAISLFLSILFLWVAINLTAVRAEDHVTFIQAAQRTLGSPAYWILGDKTAAHYFWATAIVQLLSILPAVAHLVLTLAYLLGALANFIVSYVLAVIFLRISQSKVGALTQLSIALGFVAKALQVLYKTA